MSYGGPFDSIYRTELLEIWKKEVTKMEIPLTSECGLINNVGNKVKIEIWKGL